MTDEVFSDNLDEAPEADLEAVAAVEALQAEGESVPEVAEAELTAEAASEESAEDEGGEELDAGAKAVEDFSNSLRTLEGKWYVLHTYSGYENKVAQNLETIVENRRLQELIHEVKVPVELVPDIKDGKEREVERKLFPGYVLVKMVMTDDSWYIVRNTRGVTGFVGPSSKPIPLTDEEVDKLGVDVREVSLDYAVGDNVQIMNGPLEGFIGIVEGIDTDAKKVNVKVSMFGRETPAELDFTQVKPL